MKASLALWLGLSLGLGALRAQAVDPPPAPVTPTPIDPPLPPPNAAKPAAHGPFGKNSGAVTRLPPYSKPEEIPRGATAKCNDNSFSFVQDRKTICAGHGGVLKHLNP
jgi:hypothetical protein